MADNAVTAAARQLRAKLELQGAVSVGNFLGCKVTFLRREAVKRNGKFTGITEPVYGMPAEFIEQAQSLGLLAEARS